MSASLMAAPPPSSAAAPFKASTDGITRTLAVVCTGVVGEVRQYMAFAEALQRLGGFRVRLVTHAPHAAAAAALGLAFAPLKGDVTAVLRASAFREAVAGANMLAMAALFKREADATMGPNMPLILAACRDLDGIVCSIGVLTECLAIGQKFQRPVVLAPLLPYSPSGELPLAHLFPQPARFSFLNKASYDLSGKLLWAVMGGAYNRFRTQTLGIGEQKDYELQGVPQVAGFSALTVPRPSDWGAHIRTRGYWAPPPAAAAAAAAAAALRSPRLASLVHAAAAWEPRLRPIVVALEATPPPDYVELLKAAQAAAARAGVTAIVVSMDGSLAALRDDPRCAAELQGVAWECGEGGSSSSGSSSGGSAAAAAAAAAAASPAAPSASHGGFPSLLIVADVPYHWLFAAASCVVHSGGGGVTQACWAAGVPCAAFPAVGADFFWAQRASALGVAPPAAYELRECAARLEDAARLCRTPALWGAAAALAQALAGGGEGVALAVASLRETLARPQHRHCGVVCTWAPDASASACTLCAAPFTLFNRRRHCRSCGRLACGQCFSQRCHLPGFPEDSPQITCQRCMDHRRAYFATHVYETPLPEVPAGVVLPVAAAAAAAAAAQGGGGGGKGGAGGAGSAASAGSGGGAASTPSKGGAGAAAGGSAAGRGAAVLAAPSAAVLSPGFDAVNLLGGDAYGLPAGGGEFGSPHTSQPSSSFAGAGSAAGAAAEGSGAVGGGTPSAASAGGGSTRKKDFLGKGLATLGASATPAAALASPAPAPSPLDYI